MRWLLALVLLLMSCYSGSSVTVGDDIFYVEIANTTQERQTGLMHRAYLNPDRGMWFVFEDNAERAFWMKNTLIPLDMLFIDENMTVVSVYRNVQPCEVENCPVYKSNGSVNYVLEVLGGEASVEVGETILFRS